MDNGLDQGFPSLDHKDAYRDFLRELALEGGVANPKRLADQLMILVDGLIVTCHVAGTQQYPQRTREMAALVIDAALADDNSPISQPKRRETTH